MLSSTSPLTLHQFTRGLVLYWKSNYIYLIFKRFAVKVFIMIFLGSILIFGWVNKAIAAENFQIVQEKFNKSGYLSHHPLNAEIISEFSFNKTQYSNQHNVKVKNQNKLKVAIGNYNKSVGVSPNEDNFYLNGDNAWRKSTRWNKAIVDYNPESDFKNVIAYKEQNDAKVDWVNRNRASADYQKLTEINPEFLWVMANQALELYETGEKESAITMMKNIVRKYPRFADMRAALTAAYWANGQLGEAKSHWISAYGLDSRYKDIYWVENVRCWPPSLIVALKDFLKLQ